MEIGVVPSPRILFTYLLVTSMGRMNFKIEFPRAYRLFLCIENYQTGQVDQLS